MNANIEILDDISFELSKSLEQNILFDIFVKKVEKYLTSVAAFEIYLLNSQNNLLVLKIQRGLSPEIVKSGTLEIGEGLCGKVIKKNNCLSVNGLSEISSLSKRLSMKENLQSFFGVPLKFNSNLFGVIGYYSKSPDGFSKQEKEFFKRVAERLTMALKNSLLYEQVESRSKRYMSISRAIALTRQLGTLKEVLQDITKTLVKSFGFDQSWIGMINKERNMISGQTGYGQDYKISDIKIDYPLKSKKNNPIVKSFLNQEPVMCQFIDDVEDNELKCSFNKIGIKSFAYVPILNGDETFGIIGVHYLSDRSFYKDDIKSLISVAEYASFVIENAILYEKVKKSEKRYRILFEAAGPSLAIIDKNNYFQLVNKAFIDLSKYNNEELIGKIKINQFFIDTDSGINIQDLLDNSPQNCELGFVDKNNNLKQIHINSTLINESSDILISIVDITKRRELEKRLFRSEELASIGELSASIAHEIRNPLVSITTSVNLLQDEDHISDDGHKLLDVVKEESDHLAVIVDDFLRFAKPQKLNIQAEDINQLIADVVKRHKDWNEDNIAWEENYDFHLPFVDLDRHQFQQVITNLIMNSLDAITEEGKLTFETTIEERFGIKTVKVSLNDTGIGIPHEEIDKIFQPFFSMKEKGTGMGLAICQRIIDNHGGEIIVESLNDTGTTFSIFIPIKMK